MCTASTLSILVFLTACGGERNVGSITPPNLGAPASIVFVAGDAQIDSIEATLDLPLVAVVRDARGNALPGIRVTFRSIDGSSPLYLRPASTATVFTVVVSLTTDGQGRASAKVRLGTLPGDGKVEARIEGAGAGIGADTALASITPGRETSLSFNVRDTAVMRGKTASIFATARDRHGNPLPSAQVTTRIEGSGAELHDKEFRALEFGRVTLRAHTESGLRDTIDVAIVPAGRLAIAWHPNSTSVPVFLVDSDLGNRRPIDGLSTGFARRMPDWSPAGDRLVLQIGSHSTRIYSSDTIGNLQRVLDPDLGRQEMAPVFGSDGQWIFFTLATDDQNGQIWRSRPDGSEAQRVGPAAGAYQMDYHVSASPDGSRAVFQSARGSGARLVVLDIASGDTTSLGVNGIQASWSPRGDWIVYFWEERIFRIRPDGSGNQQVGLDREYAIDLAWSADGAWIVAIEGRVGESQVVYINVDTSQRIPVPSTSAWGEVAWRPTR